MKRSFVRSFVLGTLAVMAMARASAAQESQQAAAAQVLYDEGRRLVGEGRAAEGCAKLAESNRVDPAVGTRFYLADCYERVGRTASAWAIFLEVATASKLRGHAEREALAKTRATALEPHLSKLTILVDASDEGERIHQDGVALGRASWGVPIPVDPGVHTVTAEAKGRTSWKGTVTVAQGGAATLRVPPLSPAAVELSPETQDTGRHTGRTVGVGLGAVGLVAVGVGAFAGAQALAKNSDSKALCDGNRCSPEGKTLRDESISAAWVSNVSMAVGGLALAAGAYLFFTSSPSKRANTQLNVGRSAFLLGGTF